MTAISNAVPGEPKASYADLLEFETGIPVRPAHPMPRIVCWIDVSWGGQPHYVLHDPERPDRTRQALGLG